MKIIEKVHHIYKDENNIYSMCKSYSIKNKGDVTTYEQRKENHY